MKILRKLYKKFFPDPSEFFSDKIVNQSYKSLLMVGTPLDGGFGSGVLLKSNKIITASHNFANTPAKKAMIISPSSGEISAVKSTKMDKNTDLTILTLRTHFKSPCAKIDLTSERGEGYYPVLMPVFFDPLNVEKLANEELSDCFEQLAHFGFAGAFETNVRMVDGSYRLRSIFSLCSTYGYSGAGIYNQKGELLTLDTGGNHREASGPSIQTFRDFIKKHDLA